MRLLRTAVLALCCALGLVANAPSRAAAQPAPASVPSLTNADVPREIERLEAARARTPATTPWLAKTQNIAGPLLFFYTFTARLAGGDDLAEIDARVASLHAWWSVGAPDPVDMQALWIEYYLNSYRPGLALKLAGAAQGAASPTRTQVMTFKLYQAWAYAELGRMPEAASILSAFVSFADVPPDDYDGVVYLFTCVSLRVWGAGGFRNNLPYTWRIAERLFERDALHDQQFLSLAEAGYSAAIETGDAAIAAQARAAIDRYRGKIFGADSAALAGGGACAALDLDDVDGLAKQPDFGARFFACVDQVRANGVRLPPDMVIRAARALEAQNSHAQAGAAFAYAVEQAEQARNSIGLAERQTFFEGLHRVGVQGAIQNYGLAALLKPNDSVAFFAGLAAGDRMRARQLSDMRGGGQLATPAALEAFARSLPDGVVVVAISTMDRARVAFTFTNAARRVGMATNLMPHADAQWGATVTRFLGDPSVDFDALTSQYVRIAPRILLGDGAALLKDARRVIVLADGAAARIAAATWSTDPVTFKPLGATAQIVYATSLRDLLAPPRPASRARGFFAIGNPTMPSIPTPPGFTAQQVNAISAAAGATRDRNGGLTLSRLGNAEFEVRNISRLVAPPIRTLFDGDASERAVKAAPLANLRYLHFATHGLLAGDFAGLTEPALALAPGGGEDGFLLASEVQALKLDADLTVLSACNTGSGRAVAGEGVIGLSRAFLVAGSRAVLASLWPVDDVVTDLFMGEFYRLLSAGVPPAAALQQTSAAIRKDYPHPKYWAPFILISAEGSVWRN